MWTALTLSISSSFAVGTNNIDGTAEHLTTFIPLGSFIYELDRLSTSMSKRISGAVATIPYAISA